MADGFVHTVYKNDQWVNEIEGGAELGRTRAQQDNTEHVIHNQDGTIGERNSYGNDPASRPG